MMISAGASTGGKRVGVIGLGAMGRRFARRLMGAGVEVVGFDLSADAMERLAEEGALVADSPAAVAAEASFVLTMLPEAEDVHRALVGAGGAVEGAREGSVFFDGSTIDPMSVRRIGTLAQEEGVILLDGGVSGSPPMAEEGRATLMVGGPRAAFEESSWVFDTLSDRVIYTGDLGSAKVVKLVNNMVGAVSMAAVAEAFVLADRAGVDLSVVHEAMMGSWGRCLNLEVRPPAPGIVAGSPADQGFAPDFSVDYMVKDLSYVLETARALGVFASLSATSQQLFVGASAVGEGSKDISIVVRAIEALSRA